MNHRAGDPLQALLAELPEENLERTAQCIAGAHQVMAGRADKAGDRRAAAFHRALAGDVYKRLREAGA